MSAYHAPAGTVFDWSWSKIDIIFVVLDSHIQYGSIYHMRQAFNLSTGELIYFEKNSAWDLTSKQIS